MNKTYSNTRKYLLLAFLALYPAFSFALFDELTNKINQTIYPEVKLNLLFTGDVFLDRHIDELTQADNKKIEKENMTKKPGLPLYTYPFSGLYTFEKNKYDSWIGNLECPVTEEQSTKKEKEVYLRFSCKKEYLPELKKYFDTVSLANNHTDNINKRKGIIETRKHLNDAGIKYFGDYDSSQTDEVCKIQFVQNGQTKIPIAFCGFHGVYKLPTDKELVVIKDYSKYFVTFVMPHQGVEYQFKANSYQRKVYKKMIDLGADAVIGSHPHVIEDVEEHKGKMIFYSLGNFIFDQSWEPTRKHMQVETLLTFTNYKNNYELILDRCSSSTNAECLSLTKKMNIQKPDFSLKYKPIFSNSGKDFITRKIILSEKDYLSKLKSIGFDKVASSSKIY